MQNEEVRRIIKEKGIFQYKIAERMGITEVKFSQLIRKEFSLIQKDRILKAIEDLEREVK